MAKYDSQGVPILGFHNPAGTILYPKGIYSYSIGNTRARDITELLGTSKQQHLDLLLLASGDVRNILYTVSEISLRKLQERPESLIFHLNDYDPSIVARNAILLEVAGSINPDVSGDMDFLWNIWYNMTLSEADFGRLRQILSSLIEKNFDGSDQSVLKFKDGAVLQECRDIWMDWMQLDLGVKSVKEDRNKFIDERCQELGLNVDDRCGSVALQMLMGIKDETGHPDVVSLADPKNPFYREIKHWFIEGSTSDDSDKVNQTLIRPFVHKWKQHYTACAFESYLPFEMRDLLRCKTLTAACKESLKLLVKRFQQYKKSHSAALKVTLWTGDALSLCTSGFPPELAFDVIDTSNVGDYIGLLNVLICCAPRLKKPNESLLFTSSMLWDKGCRSVEEFYNKCVGVPVQLLPTIVGLKLAVDLELGSSKLPHSFQRNDEILCWVKAEPKRTMLTIEKNSDVALALLRLVERCFNLLNEQESVLCGITLSSPLTFLRIIHQIEPLFIGGATAIFDALDSELSFDFYKTFGLSWNLLKASVGSEREPIVEIKATTEISIATWFPLTGTPIPMLCIMDHNTFAADQFQRLVGLPLFVEPTYSVIYNSLRYDDTTHVVTFHLREKDWDELKSKAWMWIATSDLIPVIKRELMFLGGEAVETTGRVDPVETFGLFSVKAIAEAESTNDCEILKVLKVEEKKFSYCAELAILDSVRCKAKAMKIRFQPVACPTKVTIYFEGAVREQCIMYFSCAVDDNSSKFQISSTQGKVFCHIPKREDGTVGELVIKCPAPVPFHVMPLWEYKLIGTITKVCHTMFCTKLDYDLRAQGSLGPPFYNLRETICVILLKHIKEPEVPKIYCIDELGAIEEQYETPDVMARKTGFVIKVQEMYKWKNLPFVKVLFYDCQRFANQLRNDVTAERVMMSFLSKIWLHEVHMIVADQQEKSLLRKLLYTNAARVAQDSGSDVWKDSFLSPLFPRESSRDRLEAMLGYMYSAKTRPTEQEISPDGLSEFLSGLLESEMGSFFTGMDRTSNFGPPQWAPPLREPECAFCHSKIGDFKRCLGCKKVFYCGKQCQTQHWKKHKPECQNRDSK